MTADFLIIDEAAPVTAEQWEKLKAMSPPAKFRHESDTSREAAETLTTAQKNRKIALVYIQAQGLKGATIDEISIHLTETTGRMVPPNAISGRFSELVDAGLISKTPQRRKTRSGKNAVVYIAGSWTDHFVEPAPAVPQETQFEAYKAKLAREGHGHVVPRGDAKRQGCGGPKSCRQCRTEKQYFDWYQAREKKES